MKKLAIVLTVFLAMGFTSLAHASKDVSMVCTAIHFKPQPIETFSVQKKAGQTTVFWDNGDFTNIVKALKYADPDFSEDVARVSFVFAEGECKKAASDPALHLCNSAREAKVLIELASGKSLSIDAEAQLMTSTTTVRFLGDDQKVLSNTVVNASFTFMLPKLWSKPLYTGVQSNQNFGLGTCRFSSDI